MVASRWNRQVPPSHFQRGSCQMERHVRGGCNRRNIALIVRASLPFTESGLHWKGRGSQLAITTRKQGLSTSVTLEALFPDERSNNSLRHVAGFGLDHWQFGGRCRGQPVIWGQSF